MPYPDNFNQEAFDRAWGDAPKWEQVLESNAASLYAAVNRTFREHPGEPGFKARYETLKNATSVFERSLCDYMPLFSNKRKNDLIAAYVNMGSACADSDLAGTLDAASDWVSLQREALERKYD